MADTLTVDQIRILKEEILKKLIETTNNFNRSLALYDSVYNKSIDIANLVKLVARIREKSEEKLKATGVSTFTPEQVLEFLSRSPQEKKQYELVLGLGDLKTANYEDLQRVFLSCMRIRLGKAPEDETRPSLYQVLERSIPAVDASLVGKAPETPLRKDFIKNQIKQNRLRESLNAGITEFKNSGDAPFAAEEVDRVLSGVDYTASDVRAALNKDTERLKLTEFSETMLGHIDSVLSDLEEAQEEAANLERMAIERSAEGERIISEPVREAAAETTATAETTETAEATAGTTETAETTATAETTTEETATAETSDAGTSETTETTEEHTEEEHVAETSDVGTSDAGTSETAEETTEVTRTKRENLMYVKRDTTYFYLPYINDSGEEAYLCVKGVKRGKEEDIYIDFDEEKNNRTKEFKILSTNFSPGKRLLLLKIESKHEMKDVTLPIHYTDDNKEMFDSLEHIVKHEGIHVTEVTDSTPEVKNFKMEDAKPFVLSSFPRGSVQTYSDGLLHFYMPYKDDHGDTTYLCVTRNTAGETFISLDDKHADGTVSTIDIPVVSTGKTKEGELVVDFKDGEEKKSVALPIHEAENEGLFDTLEKITTDEPLISPPLTETPPVSKNFATSEATPYDASGTFPAGNLTFSQEGIDYVYMPYFNVSKEPTYLRLMRNGDKDIFIKVDDRAEDGTLTPKTYKIVTATTTRDDELVMELINNDGTRTMTMPIRSDVVGNKGLFETVEKLAAKAEITSSAITEAFPEVKNFALDELRVFEPTTIAEMKKLQGSRAYKDRVGQALEDVAYTDTNSRTLRGTSFGISMSKVEGFTDQVQRVSTLVSGDSKLLFNVTRQNGENTETLAEFTQADDGKISMRISKEYADSFITSNPLVKLALSPEGEEYYTCEIDEINLDNNGSIRVRARNVEDAYFFSGLGMSVMDAGGHAGALATTTCLDIAITDLALQQALESNSETREGAPAPSISIGRPEDKGRTQFYKDSIEYSMAQAIYRNRTSETSDYLTEQRGNIERYEEESKRYFESEEKLNKALEAYLPTIRAISPEYASITPRDLLSRYTNAEKRAEIQARITPKIKDSLDILSGVRPIEDVERELASLDAEISDATFVGGADIIDLISKRTLLDEAYGVRKDYIESHRGIIPGNKIHVVVGNLAARSDLESAKLYVESRKKDFDVNAISRYEHLVRIGDIEGATRLGAGLGLSDPNPKTIEELYSAALKNKIPEGEPAKSYVEAEIERLNARHTLTVRALDLLTSAGISVDRKNYTFEDVQKMLTDDRNKDALRAACVGKTFTELQLLRNAITISDLDALDEDYKRDMALTDTVKGLKALETADKKQKDIEANIAKEQARQPIFTAGDVSFYAVEVKTLVEKTGDDGRVLLDDSGNPILEETTQKLFIRREGRDSYVYAHVMDDKGKPRDPQWLKLEYSYVTSYKGATAGEKETYGLRFDCAGKKDITGFTVRMSSLEDNLDLLDVLSDKRSGILKDSFGKKIKNQTDEKPFEGYRGITATPERTSSSDEHDKHHVVAVGDKFVEVIDDTHGKNSARLPDENIALTNYEVDRTPDRNRLIDDTRRQEIPSISEPKQPTKAENKDNTNKKKKYKTRSTFELGDFEGKPPKQSTSLTLVGLSVLFLMLSVFIPGAQVLAIVFGLLEVAHQSQPWNWIGWLTQDKTTTTVKEVKEKKKDRTLEREATNERSASIAREASDAREASGELETAISGLAALTPEQLRGVIANENTPQVLKDVCEELILNKMSDEALATELASAELDPARKELLEGERANREELRALPNEELESRIETASGLELARYQEELERRRRRTEATAEETRTDAGTAETTADVGRETPREETAERDTSTPPGSTAETTEEPRIDTTSEDDRIIEEIEKIDNLDSLTDEQKRFLTEHPELVGRAKNKSLFASLFGGDELTEEPLTDAKTEEPKEEHREEEHEESREPLAEEPKAKEPEESAKTEEPKAKEPEKPKVDEKGMEEYTLPPKAETSEPVHEEEEELHEPEPIEEEELLPPEPPKEEEEEADLKPFTLDDDKTVTPPGLEEDYTRVDPFATKKSKNKEKGGDGGMTK